jgi:hypothetical protein
MMDDQAVYRDLANTFRIADDLLGGSRVARTPFS